MEKEKKQVTTVLYINSEMMGGRDDELGAILMGNFLSTLGDFVKDVSHILLVNGGVKLACEGSDKLDLMNMLDESGVEILSCKTCLEHFGLTHRVRAGSISNMFSILEALTGAGKVISP